MTTSSVTSNSATSSIRISPERLIIDPKDNYRWRSQAAMDSDLARITLQDGEPISFFDGLKASVATVGVQEPIGVIAEGNRFRVVYGFTRATAALAVSLNDLPAIVYPSVEAAQAAAAVENANGLRHATGWIQECEYAEQRYNQIRPIHETDEAAWTVVAAERGISSARLRIKVSKLKEISPTARMIALIGDWSFDATVALASLDQEPTYIDNVMAEIRRSEKKWSKVSATGVLNAAKRVSHWLELEEETGKEATWQDQAVPRSQPAITTKINGSLLDFSINMASLALERGGLTLASPTGWDSLPHKPTWQRIIGVALASGETPLPDKVDNMLHPVMLLDAESRTMRFVMKSYIGAAIRRDLENKVNWPEWYDGKTEFKGVNSVNRHVFQRAIEDATDVSLSVFVAANNALEMIRKAVGV